ncbi:hypothetical protein HYH03_011051 [Edaphochlamys debaryana]|uniref:non-specific serine/threonine protein kinase n=1 Tax=Edaphochlamys debaryana TaxID=47281 RepID=A0A836BWZ0_9CHLO|nr:hypothetical protein HYH03_011051 [Edaphochlamys debaryana]|eukprot:KAG2490663.1 hypothetical protein HYH03_011051 [Edaphochlamys debaryana]
MASFLASFSCAAFMAARTTVACITGTGFSLVASALRTRAPPAPVSALPSGPRVLWCPDWAPAPPAGSVSSACSSAPGSIASAESSDAARIASELSATLEAGEAAPSEGFPGFTILSVGEQLGAGAFGKVEAVTIQMADGTICEAVMKTLNNNASKAAYDREVKALEAARGVPYVVQMYGACQMGGRYCIVLERIRGVSLLNYVEKAFAERGAKKRTLMPYAQIAKLASQLLAAVRDMHALGFAHNDLKIENMMLREGSGDLCLLDLGNASWTDSDGNLQSAGGTIVYMSPAMLAALQHKGGYSKPTFSSDVFSCGVCIACMTEYGTHTSEVRGMMNYQVVLPRFVPEDLADLMYGTMDAVPEARYTPSAAGSHPFMQRMLAS